MKSAYMPFTYLSESTARTLSALVGPVVVYQPLASTIPESLGALATQDLVEIRTPIARNDGRLRTALSEFTDWARMNPGKSTPGADYFSQRQGKIPFFEETAVNRIRSDINRYRQSDALADHETEKTEAEFSARLFLSLAQENDQATDRLDDDLNRFKVLENVLLDTLKDADDVGFDRQAVGAAVWRDDPGSTLSGQRIRAWATLAVADAAHPDVLVTTSRAVIDALMETHGDALRLNQLAAIRLPLPPADTAPLLSGVLADLANRESLPTVDLSSIASSATDAVSGPDVAVTFFGAANLTPATLIRQMAPAAVAPHEEDEKPNSVCNTLIILVES